MHVLCLMFRCYLYLEHNHYFSNVHSLLFITIRSRKDIALRSIGYTIFLHDTTISALQTISINIEYDIFTIIMKLEQYMKQTTIKRIVQMKLKRSVSCTNVFVS